MSTGELSATPSVNLQRSHAVRQWARRRYRPLLGTFGVAMILLAWQASAWLHLIDPFFTSSPVEVVKEASRYLSSPQASTDLIASGKEFALGFGGALLIGIPLGILLGWYHWLDALFDPLITFLYASPRIALTPLMIIWFGIGLESKAVIVGILAIFPILINMSTAVRTVDQQLVTVGRGFHASSFQILRTIALPASLPSLAAGVRLGIGQSLIGVFVAELMGASAGIGYAMNQAGQNFQISLVFVTLFIIAGFGVVFSLLLRRVERMLTRWRV